LLWEPGDDVDAAVRSLVEGGYARDRLTLSCVKIFLDGETATGQTAALLEPYQPADGSVTTARGALAVPADVLADAVTRFDRAGLTVKFHAWGDGAVDAALTAVAAARSANGPGGPRHEIGHVMLAHPKDIARARESHAVLEFSPAAWNTGAMFLGRDLGELRPARAWPVRDALDAGAAAVAGTDWPSGPPQPYAVWAAIATLVTRLNPGSADGEPFAAGQRLTLEQAIALFTTYPALNSGDPAAPGIIAPGRKADLVVLDRNPFAIPITEVPLTAAVMTIVGGEVVHEAAAADQAGD
jgi:predicted amidohydrolase YtcJ